MYAIETELGRFVAEDEKSAKKLLRAAEAKAAEAERVASERRKIADTDARLNALFLIEKTFRGDTITVETPEESRCVKIVETSGEHGDGWRLEIWTRNGEVARDEWSRPEVTGVILNGAGWPLALCFGEREWYAVGGHERALALHPMPDNWTPDMQLPDPNDLGYLDAISDGAAR